MAKAGSTIIGVSTALVALWGWLRGSVRLLFHLHKCHFVGTLLLIGGVRRLLGAYKAAVTRDSVGRRRGASNPMRDPGACFSSALFVFGCPKLLLI